MPVEHQGGYGRPPKKHRWKKGQSGNPKGRKRKTTNPTELFSLELSKIIAIPTPQGDVRMTKLEAVITSIVNDAIKGDTGSRKLLLGILNVSKPADKFEPLDEETAAFDVMLAKLSKKGDG